MTLGTSLELLFADGEYCFDLKLPQLAELQEKRGPIFQVYARVLKGRYLIGGQPLVREQEGESFAEDLFDTIRLGLIGGGRGMVNGEEVEVSALAAKRLVERYCIDRPLVESWAVAAAILAARVVGYEPKKKAEPEPEPVVEPAPRKRKASTSKRSSAPAP